MIADDPRINTNSNNYKAGRDFFSISLTTTALAQTTNSDNNKTQQWIDKENNAKIIFAYDPASPVIGKPTKLLFAVQFAYKKRDERRITCEDYNNKWTRHP